MDEIMSTSFPQRFFIPDIYPEQIPVLVFESDDELLNWVQENKGGYNFINFMYTAIQHAVYNSIPKMQICKLVTPSVKLSMDISEKNYGVALTRLLDLAIEAEYYELCSEMNGLIAILKENKKYFE